MPELLPTNTIEIFLMDKKGANGFQWGIVVFGQNFWTVCIMGKNSFEIQFNRKKMENKYEPKKHNCGFNLNKRKKNIIRFWLEI